MIKDNIPVIMAFLALVISWASFRLGYKNGYSDGKHDAVNEIALFLFGPHGKTIWEAHNK